AGKIGGAGEREKSAASVKESRSLGAGGLADIIAAQGGERIRFCLLKTHYRSTVIYGDESLQEANENLERFYGYFERFLKVTRQRFFNLPAPAKREAGEFAPGAEPLLQAVHRLRASFLEKMDDDFNTGGAIADLFDMVRELNRFANECNLDRFADVDSKDTEKMKELFANPDVKLLVRATAVLRELSNILGLFRQTPSQRGGASEGVVPKLMMLLIELRAEARAKKDFATGDKIRKSLAEAGITLEDRKGGGTEWRIGGGS
ncbi:MAG TPA: DALR domain-containing protein, partial [Pirellulaceae bacterium]|nr:DALR domain-containing protein [Pirellulaceae bacterium]